METSPESVLCRSEKILAELSSISVLNILLNYKVIYILYVLYRMEKVIG